MSIGMHRLIGKTCQVVFDLPSTDWPFTGYPAFVIIIDVDMPLVLMRSMHSGNEMWVNSSCIKTISSMEST